MIMDELLEFADATALSTSGTGLAAVGAVIDLGAVPQDLGNGKGMYLVIQVTTAVTSAGSATVSFQLVSDGTSTLAADASETLHYASAAIPKATLVAGYELVIPVPLEGDKLYERYLGIQQNVGTAALTAGAINAFLTFDPKGWKSVPDAVN
jgi:hypothetical protein